MKIRLKPTIKQEILKSLKSGEFIVTEQSQICEIFEVYERHYEVFKMNKRINLTREAKIELIKWLDRGFINDEDEELAKLIKHSTFLEIMIAASQVKR